MDNESEQRDQHTVTRLWLPRALAVMFLLGMVMNAVRPMVSYQAVRLGADPVELGIVTGSFALLSFVLAVPAGRQVDRFGPGLFVITGPFLITAVALSLVVIDNIPALALSQVVLGLGQILTAVGLQTLLANGGEPSGKDARFGAMAVAVSLGQVAGPALAGVVASSSPTGPQDVFWGSAVAITVAGFAGLSLWRWPPARLERSSRPSGDGERMLAASRRVLRISGMPEAMVASMSVLAGIDILIAYLPAYGEAHALPVSTVGFLLSTRAAASMASRVAMVPLLRAYGRRRVLTVSTALPAVAFAAIPFVTATPVLFALMLCAGLGLGLGQPMTTTWVASVPVDLRGTALGMRLSGNRFAQLTMPGIVGLVAGTVGLSAVFWTLAALLSASATMIARRFEEQPAAV